MLHKECNSLAQRNEQLGMRDAGTQFLRGIADAFDRTEDVFHQFVHVAGATVGQFPFGQRPDPFIGVKLRCIRRKVLDPQATMLVQQLFDRCSFVCFCANCCVTCAARSSLCWITPPHTKEHRSNNCCTNIVACGSSTFLLMHRSLTPMKGSGLWPNGNWPTVAPATWTN